MGETDEERGERKRERGRKGSRGKERWERERVRGEREGERYKGEQWSMYMYVLHAIQYTHTMYCTFSSPGYSRAGRP